VGDVYVRDPIHGMIKLNSREAALIKHEAFQRLNRIRQLAMTYKVYPGATHTRFEHSLGVMHIVGQMMERLRQRDLIRKHFNPDEYDRLTQLVRLAALLHDVGHAPFSHGGEECFASNLKHEHYSVAVIRECFGPIINEYFPEIEIEEIIALLEGLPLGTDKVFLGKLISGEMDADKLDYLLRDSYYCGVHYGKYDLHRILDTITVIPARENSSGELNEEDQEIGVWLLGVDSDGIQVVEELIFARYWMFIQVYFHKTRRIYDYYLSCFLKDWLSDIGCSAVFPLPDDLENYLAFDDSTVLEAIKSKRKDNEWARRIYERDHLSEAFVTSPHHAGLESYYVISELKNMFEETFGPDCFVDDRARKLPTNPLFNLKKFEDDEEDSKKHRFGSITVQDKHYPEKYQSIFELSLPLKLLSQKYINIVRFYVPRERKKEASEWCHQHYEQIKSKVKKIEEGWS